MEIDEPGVEPYPPPMSQVIADAGLAIIAGSDTTATVLSNIFYYLMTTPNAYTRLQAEIDKTFPPGENALDPSKYLEMPYLSAVM
jgi:cytochrome P450